MPFTREDELIVHGLFRGGAMRIAEPAFYHQLRLIPKLKSWFCRGDPVYIKLSTKTLPGSSRPGEAICQEDKPGLNSLGRSVIAATSRGLPAGFRIFSSCTRSCGPRFERTTNVISARAGRRSHFHNPLAAEALKILVDD